MLDVLGRLAVSALTAVLIFSAWPSHDAVAAEADPRLRLYVLSFNRWGDLVSPAERDLAIAELRASTNVERIIIFSYGWANDAEVSYATYHQTLEELDSVARSPGDNSRTAVIAVGWDSSQTGFRKLFNNLIPLPGISNTLAWLPDHLLFPISFWSKAAQADRIGFGGLRTTLNRIFQAAYEGRDDHPEIFLIGHSFGTRILSGLMRNHLGIVPVRSEEFVAAEHVKGAVLLQPALVLANLHQDAHYPLLVTMSRHDHANGLLFPIANIPINAYGFTAFEALFRHQVFEYVEDRVGSTVQTVTDIVTAPLPDLKDKDVEPEPQTDRQPTLPSRAMYLVRRSSAELVSIPASLAFTLLVTPASYAYTQLRAFVTHPVNQVMDSLAQIPVVEVVVAGLDHALGRELPWGQRSKGIFNLGPLHESIGRLLTTTAMPRELPPLYSPDELLGFDPGPDGCGLPTCSGILLVDASTLIRRGAFGEDLENPWVNFTIAWFDPLGAHGDYLTPEVAAIMALITDQNGR
jgi:hypothetical protein